AGDGQRRILQQRGVLPRQGRQLPGGRQTERLTRLLRNFELNGGERIRHVTSDELVESDQSDFLPAGERLPVLASDEVAVVPAPRPQVVKEPLVPAFRAKLRRIRPHGLY